MFQAMDFWQRRYGRAKISKLLGIKHAYYLERVQEDKTFAKGQCIEFDGAQRLV
ncbi:hypothetical protein [Streptococcus hyointestinalis]|uniref:hypothetical protein n=1 Tax=Streptococcus hyointestinalis TaxID=1337 RepID=UPI001F14DEEB|nr:hypothetical protein [Streptococcus hyointestinalis]